MTGASCCASQSSLHNIVGHGRVRSVPYVRRRGNHLAIVHGSREPETGKVEQQVLMTLHSKAEALAATGRASAQQGRSFRAWMEGRYPTVRFQWPKLEAAIDQMKEELPDLAKSRDERALGGFQEALDELTRHIIAADPQVLDSARHLLDSHRAALRWLAELIALRLDRLDRGKPTAWSRDPFGWRLALRGGTLDPALEEGLARHLEQGDLERAHDLFRFVLRMYPSYAEGWNYLGLVALRRRDFEEALRCFEMCEVEGRKLFPTRIAKRDYWGRVETRPYVRALRNQWDVLNRLGRHAAALRIAERLERQCGDDLTALAYRSMTYLNSAAWDLCYEHACRGAEWFPEHALLAAFAAFELDDTDQARAWFVRAVAARPHCVGIVLGKRTPAPKDVVEATDRDCGIDLAECIGAHLDARSRRSKDFFSRLWREEGLR